ncbi:C-Jun-amino-terminal kinase-interacting protein 4-like isoform X2 [Clavelina lepadiformis]|uniref:C-Jun-amino-terminal kinase-interacting protein 4-like isoform X2 n=1 Tax=Clavelina lepadiformis TaxID=159417 RepID=UPI004041037B
MDVIYGSEQELNSGLSSEKVQAMANNVYSEFQRMMALYGEDVIKELMPLIVTILEALDHALTDCNESAVEIEMLKDDNEQLVTQYDRERQLRRTSEQRLLEYEDQHEVANREIRSRADGLETAARHLELKCKNYSDQVERLQEREAEFKREYSVLHDRHTEMIQSYMEHIEKTKTLQQQVSFNELSQSPVVNFVDWYRKDLTPGGSTISPAESTEFQGFTPDQNQNIVQSPVVSQPGFTSTPGGERSHVSLQDELPKSVANIPTSPAASDVRPKVPSELPLEIMDAEVGGVTVYEPLASSTPNTEKRLSHKNVKKPLKHDNLIENTAAKSIEVVVDPQNTSSLQPSAQIITDDVENFHEISNKSSENSKRRLSGLSKTNIVSDKDATTLPDLGSPSVESEGAEWVMSSAVEDYRNETPELEKRAPNANTEDVDSPVGSRVYEKNQVTNESSLYAELSQQDIGDVDEGADILVAAFEENSFYPPYSANHVTDSGFSEFNGMSKEVENLILENTKLLATKNALNVVKDDLIQQVDQLSTQHTLLREELKCSENAKTNLTEKVKELESQLSKLQHDLKKTAIGATTNTTSKQIEEEDVLPLSQRKRFTRVEMARVLMERNQYKERLMELQEAVRWTETLRASRNHPDVNQNKNKNKSTIFHFFSRLFTSGNNNESSSQTSEMQGRNMRRSMGSDMSISMAYNAPSSKVIPRSHSSTISMYGRSPTIDALREEIKRRRAISECDAGVPVILSSSPSKRDGTRREVQSKINDNSRLQACGWSLPNSPASPKEGSRTVPVPVYCAPMLDNDNNMKLWCATAVNISDGRTKDGGAVVGTGSVFYDNSENIENNEDSNRKSPGSLEKLDEEIETQKQYFKTDSKHNMLSSYVWLISGDSKSGTTSKGSMVTIVDASEPNRCIDKFSVGVYDTHILCITSVPGASKDDYIRAEDSDLTSKAGTTGFTAGPSSANLTTSCNQELATEATEETVLTSTAKSNKRGVTEHVFTDPNSIHPTSSTNVVDGSSDDPEIGKVEKVQSPVITPDQMTADLASGDSKVDCPLDATRLASLQPTMWLGAQSGYVYVHSAISNWKKCLHQIRLKDSVLAIVHLKGRTLAALADGTVAIFRRNTDGVWNLSNYHLLDLGRPHHSIRCMSVVYNHVWCAYRNKIHIVEPQSIRIFKSFDAHPRRESQVRQLAWAGDGVWVSIRLDSTVRLYHARTLQHLQDVDVEPYVSKVLGSGKLGFSFVRITSLMISNYRLWIGTGNGVVMSVPLSEGRAKTTTLERRHSCIKYQDTIAQCGVARMRCLVCSKILVPVDGGDSGTVVADQCVCRRDLYKVREVSPRKRTTKMNKKAGRLLRLKFLKGKGAKTSTSSPILSSSPRNQSGEVIRVYSDPVTEKVTPGTFIPYCSMANAQLSFHGYRDAVKFFVAIPGCVTTSSSGNTTNLSPPKQQPALNNDGVLVISGGEGYVDFRKGDLGAISPEEKHSVHSQRLQSALQNSHIIIWQLTHS